MRCQTYGYLPDCRASPPIDRYLIILIGDRGVHKLGCEELAWSRYEAAPRSAGSRTRDVFVASHLHWLPVNYRIQFKIATLTYKTLATCQPSYLYNLLQVYHPSRALRSLTQQLLHVPYMSTDFGRRAFSYSSPATWNSIHISIKNCSSLYSFKRHLKSY